MPDTGASRWLPHAEFLQQRTLHGLDAVRALAVLFVLASHGRVAALHDYVSGKPGVFAFFALSGLLITTLLLAEEERTDGVRVGAFTVRRLTRIVPLLYLLVAANCVAVLVLHLDEREEAFAGAVPWMLALMPEVPYAAGGDYPINITWSIGIEEKFYLLWPLAAFALLAGRPRARLPLACGVAVSGLVLAVFVDANLFLGYAAIGLGCAMALLLRQERTYDRLMPLLHGRPARYAAWPLLLVALLSTWHDNTPGTALFSVVLALVLAGLITAVRPPALLRSRFLIFVGGISYGVYLIHYNVLRALELAIAPDSLTRQIATILFGAAITIGLAALSRRWFEDPIRDWGRRVTGSRRRADRAHLGSTSAEEPAST